MFECFQVIELDGVGKWLGQVEFAHEELCFEGEKEEFPDDCCAMDMKDLGTAPLGDARAEKSTQQEIFMALLLAIVGVKGGAGEGLTAAPTGIALYPNRIGPSKKLSRRSKV